MAQVPDHLVPTDGLTDARIRFSSLDVHQEGGADVHFGLYDEDENHLADFVIYVEPTDDGSIDRLVAEAHRRMCDVLRQWLYMTDKMRQAHEERSG
jgi:hypothetical protein